MVERAHAATSARATMLTDEDRDLLALSVLASIQQLGDARTAALALGVDVTGIDRQIARFQALLTRVQS